MHDSPSVRVSAARDLIAFLDRFEPGAKAAVLSRFPRESLEVFDSSPRTSWMPIEHHHWVVDGVCEVLGRERCAGYFVRPSPGAHRRGAHAALR
jgi:hypothetical protein